MVSIGVGGRGTCLGKRGGRDCVDYHLDRQGVDGSGVT